MRKIFVVLLVLAIAGGAFAQEEGKGTWGTLTGEGKIQTTIDFYDNDNGFDWDIYQGDKGKLGDEKPRVGMYGGDDGANIRLDWDYDNNGWTAHLPFVIEAGRFGTVGADNDAYLQYNPDGGPLTLKMPFKLNFIRGNTFWDNFQDVSAEATYVDPDYELKIKFSNLLDTNDDRDSLVKRASIGGRYLFGGKAELVASWGGAYGSDWWRASDIVLGNVANFGYYNNDDEFVTNDMSYSWENVADHHGLAFKLNASDALNFGISFAGQKGTGEAGDAAFTKGQGYFEMTETEDNSNDFMRDFIGNFVVGMKFDGGAMDLPISASFMIGLWTLGRDGDDRYVKSGDSADDDTIIEGKYNLVSNVPLHFGLKFKTDVIEVGADISALFIGKTKYQKAALSDYDSYSGWSDENYVSFIPSSVFNAGLNFQFGSFSTGDTFDISLLSARVLVKMLDLSNKNEFGYNKDGKAQKKKIAPKVSADLWVGLNRSFNGDNQTDGVWNDFYGNGYAVFDGKGNGLYAGLWLGIADLIVISDKEISGATGIDFNVKFGLGYKATNLAGLPLDFDISASLGVHSNSLNDATAVEGTKVAKNLVNEVGFDIIPELVWKINPNSNISFKYELGSTNVVTDPNPDYTKTVKRQVIDINRLTVAFQWWLQPQR